MQEGVGRAAGDGSRKKIKNNLPLHHGSHVSSAHRDTRKKKAGTTVVAKVTECIMFVQVLIAFMCVHRYAQWKQDCTTASCPSIQLVTGVITPLYHEGQRAKSCNIVLRQRSQDNRLQDADVV